MNYNIRNKNDSAGNYSNIEDEDAHKNVVIINCVVNAPLMFMSIVGNTLILAAILRTPSLRSSPSTIFIGSLAVSDLLVAFVVQPLYIAKELTPEALLLDYIQSIMAFSACGVSLCVTTAISVDRCLALHYHLRYPMLVTATRAIYTLGVIWIITFIFSGFYFFSRFAYHIAIAVGILICLVISTVCYIKIYRTVCFHRVRINAQKLPIQPSKAENTLNFLRLKASALNAFAFYVFMILCYLPNLFYFCLNSFSFTEWEKAWIFADTVVFLNSSINPFLYILRLHKLRAAVLKLCTRT